MSFPELDALSEDARLRLFIASVTDYALYMLSPTGTVITWNAGAERFKGYTSEEIIGQHFSRFYTEEDRAKAKPKRALETAVAEGKFEDEGWRVRKDGTQFWASVVIDPIRDYEGNLVGFAKITRDITDRKLTAEALHASEQQFRLLVQGVTDYAIYMLSPVGNITNWNAGAERIKGFTKDEVIGSHFSRFYAEEDRDNGLPERALTIAAAEGRFESEGWRIRKDGSQFWAHVVIDPIKNDLGEFIGFAKVTRDVTERRNTSLALEKTKEALFHSQKLESIGKLTGGVAHDFNNLLGVVMNGLSLLRSTQQSVQNLKILDTIERAVNRGETLTQQLLTFARQQPLKQQKQDINRIIGSFEAVLRRANKNEIDFKLDLATSIPCVIIDDTQFEVALLNLVVNANYATPEGGTITVKTSSVTLLEHQVDNLPPGQYVAISVIDTGHGMSAEVAKQAVEPFFTTKPVGKGTGLGLSQVYGLVKQSNGELVINSTPNQGTSITLYLPVVESSPSGMLRETQAAEKALIVDDNPDVLEMAVQLFHTLGYDVLSANNGEDALEVLERNPDIDVLFSDVVMPGISGIELGTRARLMLPDIKIILASGYPGPALQAEHTSLDDFEFIAKPYRVAEIVKKLRTST